MQYRKIPNTDLEVSAISLGSWVFGGEVWGEAQDDQSMRVIEEAIDSGINFIDTAPIYGNGRSEEVIGRALQGKLKNVIIATKCGLEQRGPSIKPNLTASFIRKEIENSLKRLNVEKIDLYQCHWPDPKTPLEETFTELKKLVKEGKIRYIGVSNFEKDLLEKAASIAPIVTDQMQYSLLDRRIEKELMPFCKDKKIAILSYGPLGGGILTGKYKTPPAISKGDVKSFFYRYYREPEWGKAQKLIGVLKEIAQKRGAPISQVAINWVLSHTEVASCIVGSRTPEQLKGNIGAADWNLSEEEFTTLTKVV